MHMAELLLFMGDIGQARKLFHEASDLKERFNEKFWMQKEQYFVLGLDSRGRPIRPVRRGCRLLSRAAKNNSRGIRGWRVDGAPARCPWECEARARAEEAGARRFDGASLLAAGAG